MLESLLAYFYKQVASRLVNSHIIRHQHVEQQIRPLEQLPLCNCKEAITTNTIAVIPSTA
jgi:predicted kinase